MCNFRHSNRTANFEFLHNVWTDGSKRREVLPSFDQPTLLSWQTKSVAVGAMKNRKHYFGGGGRCPKILFTSKKYLKILSDLSSSGWKTFRKCSKFRMNFKISDIPFEIIRKVSNISQKSSWNMTKKIFLILKHPLFPKFP